jgi:tRNA modification GTPase
MANDVIAAIATPSGRGGVAVIRLSGPRLQPLLAELVKREVSPRQATLCKFRDAQDASIDQGLVLYFPAPHSYTGEDVLEVHAHGGPVVVQLLLARCLELGARIAEPGEFTRRAFLNDKLDLAQAEGVADLINATTAEAARCALRSLQGEFSDRINHLVAALTGLRVLVEALLDFPEEEIDFIEKTGVAQKLADMDAAIAAIRQASRQGSLLREGVQVVLAGHPNVGKSSLLNRFAGAERAIVTDLPGTTRDTIGETISIRGVPLHIIDTAGLREAGDPVEKIGISRSHAAIAKADIVLWVADATRAETAEIDAALLDRLAPDVCKILVINKTDLAAPAAPAAFATTGVQVSATSGEGIDALKDTILKAAGWGDGEGVFLARARHLQALDSAAEHVAAARSQIQEIELCAEHLRLAQIALAAITGEVTADDLLGRIFSQFCIGK